jgi:cysteinyl-tRNA synthetase
MRPKHTKPLDWTDGMVAENAAFLRFWHKTLTAIPGPAIANQHSDHILSPLHHNLNVNGVVINIQRTIKHITVEDDAGMAAELAAGVRYAASVIGLDLVGNHRWMPVHDDDAEVQALVDRRTAARAAGDWALADGIRAQLLERGVVVSDGKPGSNPVWRRA